MAVIASHTIGIINVNGQYIIQTALSWNNSQSFCMSHCNSDLGSIHSDQHFQNIQTLDQSGNIWIGLYTPNSHPFYEWIDATPFSSISQVNNFALDMTGGVYPWASQQPSGQGKECVAMSGSYDWIAPGCNASRKFLCNNCNGKLNKYILFHDEVTGFGYS